MPRAGMGGARRLQPDDRPGRQTMLTMISRFARHANQDRGWHDRAENGMIELWRRSLKAPALLYAGCLMFIGVALYHFR